MYNAFVSVCVCERSVRADMKIRMQIYLQVVSLVERVKMHFSNISIIPYSVVLSAETKRSNRKKN